MKHGAFSMVPEANEEVCNGNNQNFHDPRKQECQYHK